MENYRDNEIANAFNRYAANPADKSIIENFGLKEIEHFLLRNPYEISRIRKAIEYRINELKKEENKTRQNRIERIEEEIKTKNTEKNQENDNGAKKEKWRAIIINFILTIVAGVIIALLLVWLKLK